MNKNNNKLVVSEYFYSIQGEGRTMGTPAIFIRLTACNLMCGGYGTEKDFELHNDATWRCDTIEVWKKGKTYNILELVNLLDSVLNFSQRLKQGAHLVITGGEPLLQQERIIAFLDFLKKEKSLMPIVEIETNATIFPKQNLLDRVNYWNISPKLANSGMSFEQRLFPEVIKMFNQQNGTIFKFVIMSEEDWENICIDYMPYVNYQKIWLMPGADNRRDLIKQSLLVSSIAIREGVRFSSRLQINIWNEATGV